MWSSKAGFRAALLALALLGTGALSACSGLTPVYGERGLVSATPALRYAKPESRLDQIVYQQLALKLGRAGDADQPLVTIHTRATSRDLTRSDVRRPSQQREAIVTADIEVTSASGTVLLKAQRSASALFAEDRQVLAATEAEREAGERAARQLAETIRLTLLGALAQPALR